MAESRPTASIRLAGVSLPSFPDSGRLDAVDLGVEGGERVHVVGTRGSGLPLLLALAGGRLRPEAGTVTVPEAGMAVLLEQLSAAHLATPREAALALGVDRERFLELSSRLGLAGWQDRSWRSGETWRRRRFELALALADPRPGLVLEDPEDCLDLETLPVLAGALRERQARSEPVLVGEYRPGSLLASASRVLVLAEGRLRDPGRPWPWAPSSLETGTTLGIVPGSGAG